MKRLQVTQNFSYFNQNENKIISLKIGDIINDNDPKFQNILDRNHGETIEEIKEENKEEIIEITPIKTKTKKK